MEAKEKVALINKLKIATREEAYPFFSDAEFEFYLEENNYNFRNTAYKMLLIKAENDSLGLTGLTIADNHAYWLRLARQYQPNRTGILK